MESGLKENIHLMWLSGMQQPDHNTSNRYRTDRLKNVLKVIFSRVAQLLSKNGQLSLKGVYQMEQKQKPDANR